MNKAALLYVSMLLAGSFAIPSMVTAAEQPQAAIPTVTRLVQIFSALEQELYAHAQARNAAGMEALLADDFEMRVGAMPGNPVPRAQWLQQMSRHAGSTAAIQQMAVHDYERVVVVSFLLKRDKLAKSSGDIYMVDVWKRVGDSWQLAVRYASPAGDARFAIPGMATDTPLLDKRY